MKNNSVVADIVANQRKLERKRWFVILSFLAIGVVSLILDVMTGPAMLSVSEVVNALFGIGEVDKMTNNIVHNLRLPMALMALVVGATLAVGGAAARRPAKLSRLKTARRSVSARSAAKLFERED